MLRFPQKSMAALLRYMKNRHQISAKRSFSLYLFILSADKASVFMVIGRRPDNVMTRVRRPPYTLYYGRGIMCATVAVRAYDGRRT